MRYRRAVELKCGEWGQPQAPESLCYLLGDYQGRHEARGEMRAVSGTLSNVHLCEGQDASYNHRSLCRRWNWAIGFAEPTLTLE
jgi:hypothetical protein